MAKSTTKAATGSAYARAGVDIDEMMTGLDSVKTMVKQTATPGVLSNIGSFGGLFQSPGRNEVLVSSTDGVGTKLKVALMAGKHHTVGQDLINHCVNDILVQGARPLFFLDYIGTSQLKATVFKQVVKGLCIACKKNNCTLLGGETAEMPGLYPRGEYDLVGTIVGSVPRSRLITGNTIRPGDTIIGLPSSGLHTNGYSLARKVLFSSAGLGINDNLPGTKSPVGKLLLAIHTSYLTPVMRLMEQVKIRGMAHITGGGLIDNVPRILPDNTDASIRCTAWNVPPLFSFMQKAGKIDREEMFRVFNMGIGYVIIVRAADSNKAIHILKEQKARPKIIGQVQKGRRKVVLEF